MAIVNASLNLTQNVPMNITPVDLPFMDTVLSGNTIKEYVVALLFFVVAAIGFKLISNLIVRILDRFCRKKTSRIKEGFADIFRALQLPLFIVIGMKIASKHLALHATIIKYLDYLLMIVITYYIVRAIIFVISHASKRFVEKREREDKDTDTHLLNFFTKVIYITLWIVAFLFVLSQFGVDVSKVLTGLGIAGVAVAFALQNVLADVFASVSIYFDKPFKPGEYIEFEGQEGTVIRTGIKSTRIKILRGEEVSISNRILTDYKIHNMDRMEKRRVDAEIRVKYGTPRAKLEKLPKQLENMVKKVKKAEFTRCHLKEFKEYYIDFELIYHVKSNEYVTYMDVQHEVNLGIMKILESEGIEFAVPVREIQIKEQKSGKK